MTQTILPGSSEHPEDAAAVSGEGGIAILGVRNDGQVVKTGSDGDYGNVSLDDRGRVRTVVDSVAGISGNVAHDAVDSGNPVKIGGFGTSAVPTGADTDGDRVNAWFDLRGALQAHLVNAAGDSLDVDGGAIQVEAAAGTPPFPVEGSTAHDAASPGKPVLVGGYASAAAPANVSADGDAVDAWFLRNGAQAAVLTAAGALIGGDAANGLDVDVTRLPALPAGTNNIGDVDVLSVPAPLSTAGGGTEATALRVTLANDSTGVVSVDDNGGSLTVDGTVVANAGTGTHIVGGDVAHDGVDAGSPVKLGGYAKAAAPADVSADADRVNAWFLRNGAQATVITAGGALIGGDATNGLDVDVTRVSGSVAVTGTFWQATQPVSGTVTANAGTGTHIVAGEVAHDAVDSGNPQKVGGYAKAAAPTDVSADGDRVNAWFLRNGAQAMVLTAGGVLIPGDATNGLDVDVTRLPTRTVDVNATLTRPADTTAYADGDTVSSSTTAPTILTFSNCAQVSGGTGMIVAATMRDSAYSATPGTFELWLLDTTTTPDNDNAAFTPTDGEVDTCVAVIKFSLVFPGDKTAGATGNMLYVASGLNIPFVTSGSANLFGIVVVRGAYTPISAETFKFRLKILQD